MIGHTYKGRVKPGASPHSALSIVRSEVLSFTPKTIPINSERGIFDYTDSRQTYQWMAARVDIGRNVAGSGSTQINNVNLTTGMPKETDQPSAVR